METRRLYGRVYMHYGQNDGEPREGGMHVFMARIWDARGVDIWHGKHQTPEGAFELMREAARLMEKPVDLYQHGGGDQIAETTLGKDLPF